MAEPAIKIRSGLRLPVYWNNSGDDTINIVNKKKIFLDVEFFFNIPIKLKIEENWISETSCSQPFAKPKILKVSRAPNKKDWKYNTSYISFLFK